VGVLAISETASALIAAGVAAAVSLVVGGLTYWATIRGHRAERLRLERELQRTMTAKLYDQRMAAYPKVWKITEALRRSSLEAAGAQVSPAYFAPVLAAIDEWAATDGAMILSSDTVDALYEIRRALRDEPDSPAGYTEAQIERMRTAKGRFRRELRRDVQLLFTEEGEVGQLIKPPSTMADL